MMSAEDPSAAAMAPAVASLKKRPRVNSEEEKKAPEFDALVEEEKDSKPRAKFLLQRRRDPPFRLTKLKAEYSDTRRTNDEIHSSIILGPVVKTLVDTPQFQRLRGLKQLGTAEFVYCNATHNRFEHSLGVAHLAKSLCEIIKSRQPGLKCTAKDVLCVELAGLCHDIGHGKTIML